MAPIAECKLCRESKLLRRSHIFPRAYTARAKGQFSQMIQVIAGEKPVARKSNVDLQEYLLCDACEGYLSRAFENYGTNLFVKNEKIEDSRDFVILLDFDYQCFVLFVTSIFWRASVSSLKEYAVFSPLKGMDELLRRCILSNTLQLQPDLFLQDFIKISIIKIVDRTGQLRQSSIDSSIIPLSHEAGEGGAVFFYMVDGYLVTLTMLVAKTVQAAKERRVGGQIRNRSFIKVPKACFTSSKQIADGFSAPFLADRKFKD